MEKKYSILTIIIVSIIVAAASSLITLTISKKSVSKDSATNISGSWYNSYAKRTFVLTLNKDKTFEYGYEGEEKTKGKYSTTSDVLTLTTDSGAQKLIYDINKNVLEIDSTSYYNSKKEADKNNAFYYIPDDYDTSMFKSITVAEMIEKFNNGESAFVLTARGSCGYCQQFRPIAANSVKTHNYTLYYLNTTTVEDDDYVKVNALDAKFSDFGSTPNVYYFKDKAVVDVQAGYTDEETYNAFLERNGVAKK